jgi:CheY-like chemotaxis protein
MVAMLSRPARVLVIDDDESTRVTFAQLLRLEGHEVRTAPSASAGLDEAYLAAPDAIIVDLHMPAMDGLTFVKRLRAQQGGTPTPVAIVTGDYGLQDTVTQSLHGLGVTVCFKPLWLDDLVKLTGDLLSESASFRPEPPTSVSH